MKLKYDESLSNFAFKSNLRRHIKVFRTFNASFVLNNLLKETDAGGSLGMKKSVYDAANKEVAVLCNHQKGVGKQHGEQMEKLHEKLKVELGRSALRENSARVPRSSRLPY